MRLFASFAAAANCFCSSSKYACFVSAGATVFEVFEVLSLLVVFATVFSTGCTGCTVSSGSFGLVFRVAVVCTGSGFNKGSEAGACELLVVFCVCLPVLRGLVVCADTPIAVRRKSALMLENSRIKLDLLMMETIVFGRGFGLKVHIRVFTDIPSDARGLR